MEIEILDREGENKLILDNNYARLTIYVDPESKTFTSKMCMKADVYSRNEEFEYKIETDPINVIIRLVERVDDPPEEWKVRNGVVLESEILKNNKFLGNRFVEDLKKEVVWHNDQTNSPIFMYILSKHPDLISPRDYQYHLRQLSEKIKSANQKVEQAVKLLKSDLQIIDSEYGQAIGCSNEILEKLTDKEIEELEEHTTELKKSLFEKNSERYVGISESEFQASKDILKNTEIFLNRRTVSEGISISKKKVFHGIEFFAFMIQWLWLFIVISAILWLVSLVISIVQYNLMFVFISSGALTLFISIYRRDKQTKN